MGPVSGKMRVITTTSVVRHVRHGHPVAAARLAMGVGVQAWRTVARPLIEAIDDVATAHWAVSVAPDATVGCSPPPGSPSVWWSGCVEPARREDRKSTRLNSSH